MGTWVAATTIADPTVCHIDSTLTAPPLVSCNLANNGLSERWQRWAIQVASAH